MPGAHGRNSTGLPLERRKGLDMCNERIGFLGAGQMAEAIARGLIQAKVFSSGDLFVSDPLPTRRSVFESFGVRVTRDNLAVAGQCATLLVAVKPQNLEVLLAEIGPALTRDHLLITICAGCSTGLFEEAAREPLRVVRVMPNLPVRVRKGAAALCAGRHATPADMALARKIFEATGSVVTVEESLMDAVTALSGSGPAYFYFLVEVMIEAGCREGLPADVARELAIQTARGAAEMMAVEDAPPEELRRRVTSRGGTTEAAFRSMERAGVREALLEAIAAAAARSHELGRK